MCEYCEFDGFDVKVVEAHEQVCPQNPANTAKELPAHLSHARGTRAATKTKKDPTSAKKKRTSKTKTAGTTRTAKKPSAAAAKAAKDGASVVGGGPNTPTPQMPARSAARARKRKTVSTTKSKPTPQPRTGGNPGAGASPLLPCRYVSDGSAMQIGDKVNAFWHENGTFFPGTFNVRVPARSSVTCASNHVHADHSD